VRWGALNPPFYPKADAVNEAVASSSDPMG
jgi:hypothetical protein